MSRTPAHPRVTGILFADAHKSGQRNKYDCFGMFTAMGVYGVPAKKEFSLIFRVDNPVLGDAPIGVFVGGPGETPKRVGAGVLGVSRADGVPAIAAHRLNLKLKKTGIYRVGITVGQTSRPSLWVNLVVDLWDWPQLPSGDVLTQALADPNTVKVARAALRCGGCKESYVFEVRLDPESKLSKGAMAFPASGRFRCPKCRRIHHLKDVEGTLLSRLAAPFDEGVR